MLNKPSQSTFPRSVMAEMKRLKTTHTQVRAHNHAKRFVRPVANVCIFGKPKIGTLVENPRWPLPCSANIYIEVHLLRH